MGVSIKLEFNHLEEILSQLHHDLDTELDKAAKQVRKDAQDRVHVKTGATRASMYVSSPLGSDYGGAVGQASSLDPKAQILPEEHPEGEHSAIVGVADAAGLFEEYGTAHMPAHPYLTPSAEGHTPDFTRGMQDVLDGLGK